MLQKYLWVFCSRQLIQIQKIWIIPKNVWSFLFFQAFFCGQFEQKDRNCLLASSSKSQLFISGKKSIKKIDVAFRQKLLFLFCFPLTLVDLNG